MDEADIVLLGFPLYVTAMPGIVKKFIETMPKSNNTVQLGFFVQSGFPESYQVTWMDDYFRKLSARLDYTFLGMIFQVFGASVETMPIYFQKELLRHQFQLGRHLGETGHLDIRLTKALRNPEALSTLAIIFYKLIIRLGLADSFAHKQLRHNRVQAAYFILIK